MLPEILCVESHVRPPVVAGDYRNGEFDLICVVQPLVNAESLQQRNEYDVSGGIASREWDASITRSSVDPERPEPTMKKGAGAATSSVIGGASVTVPVKIIFLGYGLSYPPLLDRYAFESQKRVRASEPSLTSGSVLATARGEDRAGPPARAFYRNPELGLAKALGIRSFPLGLSNPLRILQNESQNSCRTVCPGGAAAATDGSSSARTASSSCVPIDHPASSDRILSATRLSATGGCIYVIIGASRLDEADAARSESN